MSGARAPPPLRCNHNQRHAPPLCRGGSACKSYDVLSFAVDTLQYDIDAASDAAGAAAVEALGLPAMDGGAASAAAGGGGGDDDDDDEPVVVMETPRLGRSALSMLSKWQSQRDQPGAGAAAGAGTGVSGTGAGAGADTSMPEEKPAAAARGESKAEADDGAASGSKEADEGDGAAAAARPAGRGGASSGSGRFKVRAPHFVPPMAGKLPAMGGATAGSAEPARLGAMPATSAAVAAVPVPPRHLCALTKSVMEDPVTSPDGVNFERSAIEDYLATRDLCPVTGKPLSVEALRTNKELSKEIALFQFRRLMLGSRLSLARR